jgi:nitrite reductase/ring-hydroxylating ferredoxin subunit
MDSQWHEICTLKRLIREQRLSLRLGAHSVLVLWDAGQALAFENRCPHQGYPLDNALLDPDRRTLTCPFHQWAFALDSGQCQLNTSCLQRFPVRIEADAVQIGIPADPC